MSCCLFLLSSTHSCMCFITIHYYLYIHTYLEFPIVVFVFSFNELPVQNVCWLTRKLGNTQCTDSELCMPYLSMNWSDASHDSSDKKNKEYIGPRWTSDSFSQLFWAIRMRKWEIKNGQISRMKSNGVSVSSLSVNEVPQNFFQRLWLVCYLEPITFVHLQTL